MTGRTRCVILATGGGPRPRKTRGPTAHAVIVDDVLYVVDCGNGVARQLAVAGVPLPSLRHVFLTHHHSDHNADYGNLIWLAWASGLRTRVDAWGPPPIARMTRLFFEMNAYDIDTRIADTMYTTFLASAFRSIRFGVNEAHGRGVAVQLNTFLDKGAVTVNPDGTFAVVPGRIREAVTGLTSDILTLQARGDYAKAKDLLTRLGVVRPEVQKVLDRLTDVPVDIEPTFVTAEELTRD